MGNQLTTPMLRKWFSIISFHNSANLRSPNLSLVTTAAVALLHSEKYNFEKQGNMAYRVREIRTTILFHRCQFEISQPLPRTRAANVNITKVKDNFAQKSAPKYQTISAVGVMVLWFLDFFPVPICSNTTKTSHSGVHDIHSNETCQKISTTKSLLPIDM